MKKIKIDNTTYNIPTSFQDITLGDYEEWFDSKVETLTDRIHLISKITKMPYEVLNELPSSFFLDLINLVSFTFQGGMESYGLKNEINIDGISYSISYKDELTLAEWVDVEAVFEQTENRLSEILAIVCRPIGEKYNSKNNPSRIKIFKELTLDKVFPLYAFFLTLNQKYIETMNLCSTVVEMADQQVELSEAFLKNGGGMEKLSRYQKMIYHRLIKHLKKELLKYSTSYPTRKTSQKPRNKKGSFKNK
ncbi:hypothetical protein [Bacteroides sp. 51]|uniref:hypothetical protein n=1 Tax=Bacteroides sp. 51 TaxID=2302938 RepID=UPI0013D39042|nr:hypothetical protein [Bacteroides sp. 51]NDV83961.1 hypothetical protein [Bacteroides sp. 51]